MSSLPLAPSSAPGGYFVRAMAMVFAQHFQADRVRERNSRVS